MKQFSFIKLLIMILLWGSISMSYAQDIYLSATGDDTNNGLTAGTAVKTFSTAHFKAVSGDIIHVSGMIDFSLDSTIMPRGVILAKALTIQGTSNATDGFDGKNLTRFFQTGAAGFNLTLSQLKFTGGANIAGNGGAIFINGGTVNMTNVIFEANKALKGGAIYVSKGTVSIENCSIINNDNSGISGSLGGGIYTNPNALNAITMTVNNSILKGNKSSSNGSAFYYVDEVAPASATIKITNSAIISNITVGGGSLGAIYVNNKFAAATVDFSVINCTISKNLVGGTNCAGIAIGSALLGSAIKIINCTITQNQTYGINSSGGGGVRFFTNTQNCLIRNVHNCIIENNTGNADPLTTTSNYGDLVFQSTSYNKTKISVENNLIGKSTNPIGTDFPSNQVNYVTLSGGNYTTFNGKLAGYNSTSFALKTGSTAINFGNFALLGSVTTDQAGNTRTGTGGKCHAGSMELIVDPLEWSGAADANWNNAANWVGGVVPADYRDVNIPATGNVQINVPVIINDLTIADGGKVTINAGQRLTANNLDLSGSEALTIKSDATVTGSLLNNTITGTGTVKVERYLTQNQTYYLSSPIKAAFSQVFSPTLLEAADGLKKYNSTNIAWEVVTIDGATLLTPGVGYAVKYTANTPNVKYSGSLNMGVVAPALVFNSGNGYAWNLVGNPYPCAIDFMASSGWTKFNIAKAIWLRKGADKTVAIFDSLGTLSINSGTRYIAQGQAFWVKATGAAPVIKMTNAIRVHSAAPMLKGTGTDAIDVIRLSVNNSSLKDEIAFRFYELGAIGMDEFDRDKMIIETECPQIYSLVGTEKIAINTLNTSDVVAKFPLGIQAQTAESLTIKADLTKISNTTLPVMLYDKVANKTIDLRVQSEYTFQSAAGSVDDRFEILIGSSLTAINDKSQAPASVYAFNQNLYVNFAQSTVAQIDIIDMVGRSVKSLKTSNTENIIPTIGLKGVYMVRIQSVSGISTSKILFQ